MMGCLLLPQSPSRMYQACQNSGTSLLTPLEAQPPPLLHSSGVTREGQSFWAFTAHFNIGAFNLFSTGPMFSKPQGPTQCGQTGACVEAWLTGTICSERVLPAWSCLTLVPRIPAVTAAVGGKRPSCWHLQ